ncbi:hypothetical protein V2A60_005483 [Cordyceps javanica]
MTSGSIDTNPFREIIAFADNDPSRIQSFCQDRWNASDRSWKAKFLSDAFEGPNPDQILVRLLRDPSYEDPRHNLTVWSRPTPAVTTLAAYCQTQLRELGLDIWLTPQDSLHMTVLVLALQRSADELDSMMPSLRPPLVKMSEIYSSHRTRLVKPAIYFSDSGVVLSYVPCAGEITDGEAVDHQYTFLHLQRDLFELGHEHGIAISAQKPPGSCYMTLGRFVKGEDPGSNTKLDPAAIALWQLETGSLGMQKALISERVQAGMAEGSLYLFQHSSRMV